MVISDCVRTALSMSGLRVSALANKFEISAPAMSNKLRNNSWFGKDLLKVADLCGCKLAFIYPDGQMIVLRQDEVAKEAVSTEETDEE